MSKHIFTPSGNTPLFVNAANGALKFMFPAPERFTISNDDILRIDDFFEPHIMPDALPGFWSGLRPGTDSTPALYLKKRVYPIGLPTPDGDTICMPYLAALIRLADEIDVTADRSSKLLYDLEAITDEHQLFEHKRHRAVRDLIISEDAFTLIIDDSDPVVLAMIQRMKNKMQQTLDTCREAVNGRTPFEITQRRVVLRPL